MRLRVPQKKKQPIEKTEKLSQTSGLMRYWKTHFPTILHYSALKVIRQDLLVISVHGVRTAALRIEATSSFSFSFGEFKLSRYWKNRVFNTL